MRERSNEPVFWVLFGAGGVLTALLLPVLILIVGIAVPLGMLPAESLDYSRMMALASSPVGKLAIFAVISLTLWHAMHRVLHTLHDLGIQNEALVFKLMTYGLAFVGTGVTAYVLAGI
ncbi:MAG: fumarate reductase subunit FrdD [Myxococcota bacterium]|nr:fumarate reductase subunit FrdD [Myxococcota bacterium]